MVGEAPQEAGSQKRCRQLLLSCSLCCCMSGCAVRLRAAGGAFCSMRPSLNNESMMKDGRHMVSHRVHGRVTDGFALSLLACNHPLVIPSVRTSGCWLWMSDLVLLIQLFTTCLFTTTCQPAHKSVSWASPSISLFCLRFMCFKHC